MSRQEKQNAVIHDQKKKIYLFISKLTLIAMNNHPKQDVVIHGLKTRYKQSARAKYCMCSFQKILIQ
jgi:hypothetical protein